MTKSALAKVVQAKVFRAYGRQARERPAGPASAGPARAQGRGMPTESGLTFDLPPSWICHALIWVDGNASSYAA